MFGLISSRRHDAEMADLRQQLEHLRTARNEARDERNVFRTAAQTSSRQLVAADAALRRVHGRNVELGRRLSPAAVGGRLARAVRACARYRAALAAETRRADRLQARLDDATGLDDPRVLAGARWQDHRPDKAGLL